MVLALKTKQNIATKSYNRFTAYHTLSSSLHKLTQNFVEHCDILFRPSVFKKLCKRNVCLKLPVDTNAYLIFFWKKNQNNNSIILNYYFITF